MISENEGNALINLARDSILTFFSNVEPNLEGYQNYSEKQGVFVTLHKDKQLRGCIGFPEPVMSLNKAIVQAARSSAFNDPRFPPLKKEELDKIKIEISVLAVPEEIIVKNSEDYRKKIVIGKHGLIIRHPYGSGLLLPQVPVEWNWNVDEFLVNICQKAGLSEDAWQDPKAKLYSFEAQVFSE